MAIARVAYKLNPLRVLAILIADGLLSLAAIWWCIRDGEIKFLKKFGGDIPAD